MSRQILRQSTVRIEWREPDGGIEQLAWLCHALLTKVPFVCELHLCAAKGSNCAIEAAVRAGHILYTAALNGEQSRDDEREVTDTVSAEQHVDELINGIINVLVRFGVQRRTIKLSGSAFVASEVDYGTEAK